MAFIASVVCVNKCVCGLVIPFVSKQTLLLIAALCNATPGDVCVYIAVRAAEHVGSSQRCACGEFSVGLNSV